MYKVINFPLKWAKDNMKEVNLNSEKRGLPGKCY